MAQIDSKALMGIEIGLTCGCLFTAGYDLFHTGIHTDSETSTRTH